MGLPSNNGELFVATSTELIRPIRTSETGIWRQCKLKWYLTFILGFQGNKINTAFWLGTLVHFVLSEWYLGRTTDPAHLFTIISTELIAYERNEGISVEGVDLDFNNVQELEESQKLGVAMLEGFQGWAEKNFSDFDVIDSELSFYLPMETLDGDDFTYVIRLDLLTENSEGIRVVDFKTAKDFRAEKTVEMDQQFRRYPWMVMRALPPKEAKKVQGSEWVALRKMIPSARSKPPYFKRQPIDLGPTEWKGVEQEIIAEATDIIRTEKWLADGVDPRSVIYPSPTFDCSWKCEYFSNGLCFSWRAGLDVSDPELIVGQGTMGNDPYSEYKADWANAVPVSIGRLET
ncbi:MAG: PD-(D/E)XK nuclease family protein [Nitrosopumilus sp.]